MDLLSSMGLFLFAQEGPNPEADASKEGENLIYKLPWGEYRKQIVWLSVILQHRSAWKISKLEFKSLWNLLNAKKVCWRKAQKFFSFELEFTILKKE